MLRCPRCGLRLSEEKPACPTHGVPAVESRNPSRQSGMHWSAKTASSPETRAAFEAEGYRIQGVLGRGGFGIVYRAERLRDGAALALKVTLPDQPDAQRSLQREADALQLVGPPYVPTVY